MHTKAEQLYIRASERERAILAQAAELKNMSVSQFVLQAAMPVAEGIVREETTSEHEPEPTIFRLSDADWEKFTHLLDEPV